MGKGNDAFGDVTAQLNFESIALFVGHGAEFDGNTGHPVNAAHSLGGLLTQLGLEGTPGDGQQDADESASLLVDGNLINHVEIGNGAFDLGVIDVRQRIGNGLNHWVLGAHADLSTHRWPDATTRSSRTGSVSGRPVRPRSPRAGSATRRVAPSANNRA